MKNALLTTFKKSCISVLPIMIVVALMCILFLDFDPKILVSFIICSLVLIVGMTLFELGAEISMTKIGTKIGRFLSEHNKLLLVLISAFLVGIAVTVAEPDLTILAKQVFANNDTNQWIFILTVALGVGFFLLVAVIRTFFSIKLKHLLLGSYIGVIILSVVMFIVCPQFFEVSFDAGSVTTGSISVPFIISFGIGLASVREAKSGNSSDQSFGMIALSSIGPILTTMVLGLIMQPTPHTEIESFTILEALSSFGNMVFILLPIIVFFLIFNFTALKIKGRELTKIILGLIYTYLGISLFLSAVNYGFIPMGEFIGSALSGFDNKLMFISMCAIIGLFILLAEPAVHIMAKDVEHTTVGVIKSKTIIIALCLGICLALILCSLKIVLDLPLFYIVVPMYIICIALTFFVPEVFIGIAFDSGGVCTGAMATTFVMPMMIGASATLGLNTAFGTLAIMACFPIFTILILGFIFKLASKRTKLTTQKYTTTIIDFE